MSLPASTGVTRRAGRSRSAQEPTKCTVYKPSPVRRPTPRRVHDGLADNTPYLKEWLAARTWDDRVDLNALLAQFQDEDNKRPHQGLALPGLSPTGFARRLWLL